MKEESVVREIENVKILSKQKLIDLTKHLEHLSKLLQKRGENSFSLRCRGYMRTINAMIHGLDNVRVEHILTILSEIKEDESRVE